MMRMRRSDGRRFTLWELCWPELLGLMALGYSATISGRQLSAYLLERLKNETTRLAAVRAIDTVAALLRRSRVRAAVVPSKLRSSSQPSSESPTEL